MMKKIFLYSMLLIVLGCGKTDNGFAPVSLVTNNPAPVVLDPRSCLDLLPQNPTSGIYSIDPDGAEGPKPAISVYCDMVTQGGGWTLVMKQRSNDGSTLQGDAAYWTNSATPTLNDSSANLNTSDQNLVSAAFTQLGLSEMMLVASNEVTAKSQTVAAASAFAAFNQPTTDYTDDTNTARPDWNIVTNTYPNGNNLMGARFGFNMRQRVGNSTYCAVRWGWTANQDGPGGGIGTSDSCGGLGAYGMQYGGSYMNGSKNIWQPATLLLFVK
jgi:Fibrinogen beta and gamma chains, C-terminal globular domain